MYGELPKLLAFDQKLRYFTDQNGPKRGPHGNEFWNSEMNTTFKFLRTRFVPLGPKTLKPKHMPWTVAPIFTKMFHFIHNYKLNPIKLSNLKQYHKGELLGLKQLENHSKMVENAFYFTSKALFILKTFTFLPWLFDHVAKWLDK